jgi:heme d1 biosynthesis radical SAM protein NirJ
MFRVTQLMREIVAPTPAGPHRDPPGPVVIWNLTRRCNLACKHCYSISSDRAYPGELSTPEIFAVMEDLRAFRVPVLILSGGEPLLHPDIWPISERAKALGFYVSLSSNGALIDDANIDRIAAMAYDYVGISLDGIGTVHDRFRRKRGAFAASLSAVRLCVARGLKVGLRFTLTQDNEDQFDALLRLMHDEGVQKFYLSHLNYGGRGNLSRGDDAYFTVTRRVLDRLFETAYDDVVAGHDREYVTGNNDADGVYLWHWVRARHPESADHVYEKLVQWGGNASGVNVANIDNLGNVHPDTFWWHYGIGNVKERPFSELWHDLADPLMAGLKQRPRPVTGRCGACAHLAICNGNTRVRAQQVSGDPWAEDPGCYLDDAEIGLSEPRERLAVTPFRPQRDAVARAYAERLRASGRRGA